MSGEAPRARGLARSARLAGLSAGSPAAAAAPQPPAGPWRLTVSALGRGGPGWEAAGPWGGKFSSLDTCPYAGLADQRLGFPSPWTGPWSSAHHPSLPGGTSEAQVVLAAHSGGTWRKGVRRTEVEGTLRCGGAEGQRGRGGCPCCRLGAVPSGPGPGFGDPRHPGTTSPGCCEFKVRLEFWVGFADLPLGIRCLDCWLTGGPTRAMLLAQLWAGQRPRLVTVGSECDERVDFQVQTTEWKCWKALGWPALGILAPLLLLAKCLLEMESHL